MSRAVWIVTCVYRYLFFSEPVRRGVKLYHPYELSILADFEYLHPRGVLVKLFFSREIWGLFYLREVRNLYLFLRYSCSLFKVCGSELVDKFWCLLCQLLEGWLCAWCRRIHYYILFHICFAISVLGCCCYYSVCKDK